MPLSAISKAIIGPPRAHSEWQNQSPVSALTANESLEILSFRRELVKLTTLLIGLAAMAVSLPAGTINFAGGGSLGSSNTYGPVTTTGYLSNSTTGTLFGKGNAGGTGSEDGLGLTADPTGDNEIFAKLATGAAASDFIQLDISALSGTIKISMGSTGGDTWAVFGSNSAGMPGWDNARIWRWRRRC